MCVAFLWTVSSLPPLDVWSTLPKPQCKQREHCSSTPPLGGHFKKWDKSDKFSPVQIYQRPVISHLLSLRVPWHDAFWHCVARRQLQPPSTLIHPEHQQRNGSFPPGSGAWCTAGVLTFPFLSAGRIFPPPNVSDSVTAECTAMWIRAFIITSVTNSPGPED